MLRTNTARLGFVASGFAISIALLSAAAIGAPVVQQVSGTLVHKASVTITGSGFGTKPTAAPLVWDDASGSSIRDRWTEARPNTGSSAYYLTYRAPQRNVPVPHSNVTRYIAGAHGEGGATGGQSVMLFKTIQVTSYPMQIYLSWYQTVDPAWVFGGDNNFKTFRYSHTTDGIYGEGWYTEYNNSTFTNPTTTADLKWHINDSTGTISIPDVNGRGSWWQVMLNPIAAGWVKQEMALNLSGGNDGYIKQWENGRLIADYQGPTDKLPGYTSPPTSRNIGIGGYARMYNQSSNWRYFSDAYLDTTLSRVVIANNSVLPNATIIENQIPSSWTSTSIGVTVNLGKFREGQSAYLFVVDSSGATNGAAGYPVTIGASEVRPNPPAGILVQ